MSDFPAIAAVMLKEGGAVQVKNGEQLTAEAHRLLSGGALSARLGAKNRALVERHSGVTSRIAEDIVEWLLKA
jgi:3-deoxy-D-manno-octulosonic-acid transferase